MEPDEGENDMTEEAKSLLHAIDTLAGWKDELRPPQNLLNQVLDAARETFAARLFDEPNDVTEHHRT
jgi:hypothetical protein